MCECIEWQREINRGLTQLNKQLMALRIMILEANVSALQTLIILNRLAPPDPAGPSSH